MPFDWQKYCGFAIGVDLKSCSGFELYWGEHFDVAALTNPKTYYYRFEAEFVMDAYLINRWFLELWVFEWAQAAQLILLEFQLHCSLS